MSTATELSTTEAQHDDGRGPGGMWWVAWRQHRWMIVALAVVTLLLTGVLIGVHRVFDSLLHDLTGPGYAACAINGDCPNVSYDNFYDRYRWWERLQVVMTVLPPLTGALLGVATFTNDLDRRTVVLGVTQSVSRLRWWACKLLVVAGPLVVSMLILGFVMRWQSSALRVFGDPQFELPYFAVYGVLPAVLSLLGLAVGAMAGISVRGALAGTCIAAVVLATAMVGIEVARPHLLSPSRQVNSDLASAGWTSATAGAWHIGSGYLDAGGRTVEFNGCSWDGELTSEQADAAWDRCLSDAGIVSSYQDYLPAEELNVLRAVVSAICAAIAALFLAAGAFVLRRRAL